MTVEIQPRLTQRIIQPLHQSGEGVVQREQRLGSPPTNTPQQRGRESHEPAWLHNPLLDQAAKERLKAYDEFMRQKMEEDRQMRANEPKGEPLLDIWRAYVQERQRHEREYAMLNGSADYTDQRRRSLLVIHGAKEPRKEDSTLIDTTMDNLTREVKRAEIDRIAESIRHEMWIGEIPPVSVIRPTHWVSLAVDKDRMIFRNHSRSGVTIAYAYDHINSIELSLGIGYFTEEEEFVPELRGRISEAKRDKGVKSYFVERTYMAEEHGQTIRKTEMYAIPLAFENSSNLFIDYLYQSAKLLSPADDIQQAAAA